MAALYNEGRCINQTQARYYEVYLGALLSSCPCGVAAIYRSGCAGRGHLDQCTWHKLWSYWIPSIEPDLIRLIRSQVTSLVQRRSISQSKRLEGGTLLVSLLWVYSAGSVKHPASGFVKQFAFLLAYIELFDWQCSLDSPLQLSTHMYGKEWFSLYVIQ